MSSLKDRTVNPVAQIAKGAHYFNQGLLSYHNPKGLQASFSSAFIDILFSGRKGD